MTQNSGRQMKSKIPKARHRSHGSTIDRLNAKQKALIRVIRACFRECSGEVRPDQVARLAALAFRAEFPAGDSRNILGQAITRGIVARRELLGEEGGSISAPEAARKLGITKNAVVQRYRKGMLVGWYDEHARATKYPLWQFGKRGLLPGIEEILRLLNESAYLDDISRIMFFLCRFGFLGDKRPLDCLRFQATSKAPGAPLWLIWNERG